MSSDDKTFAGAVLQIYDEHLAPLLFAPYAADLAARVAARRPHDVLETAAGTGAVTRALAPLLSPEARYAVTDLSGPMLEQAKARQGADDRITWKTADALSPPFADDAVDVVLCQFGVTVFPDRVAGFAEAARVLKPDGALLFSVWDALEDNPFANIGSEAVAEAFPQDPPRFFPRTPHGCHDAARIRTDLAEAGFGDVRVETVDMTTAAPSARHAAKGICQGAPVPGEIEARRPGQLDAVTDRAAAALALRFGDGAISAPIRALVVAAGR